MKATITQIQQAIPCIQMLMNAKLPAKAAYAVSKLGKACDAEFTEYQQARTKIFEGGGCVIKDNAYVNDDAEKLAVCVAEANAVAGLEVELNALPLDLDHFGNAEIPGSAFYGLEFAMKAVP